MRRKLIDFEAFDDIRKRSLSAAEYELSEAEGVLARALGVDSLELTCFGESNVVYGTLDGTFVHANYRVSHEGLTLENIEELVIDEDSAAGKCKSTVMEMVDSVLANDDARAAALFSEYISLPFVRKNFSEGRVPAAEDGEVNEGRRMGFVRNKGEALKAGMSRAKNLMRNPGKDNERKRKLAAFGTNPNARKRAKRGSLGLSKQSYQRDYYRQKVKPLHRKRKEIDRTTGKVSIRSAGISKRKPKGLKARTIKEWSMISENVLGYVDYQEYGPALNDTKITHDDKGNVVAMRVPTSHLRNEAKLLSFDWKMINQEYKILREQATQLADDGNFCKVVAEMKRQNNASDNEKFQETVEALVGKFPVVLYLTQEELARTVSEALSSLNATNYDDDTCTFLAEAVLRTAHHAFSDNVEKILNVARAEVPANPEDAYLEFQKVVTEFYPTLDENFATEMKVYQDLFAAVNEVWGYATKNDDAELKAHAEEFLEDLHAVVNGEADGDLELAEDVAEWLDMVAEAFSLSSWDVDNTPYVTVNGDNPEMFKKAKQGYTPADFDGGNTPKSKTIDDTDKNIWVKSRDGMWPNVTNPYIPKPFGDYTMKSPTGERGVDKTWETDGLGMQQGKDTWPNLTNPVIPKGETPKSYKPRVSGLDLVVDR